MLLEYRKFVLFFISECDSTVGYLQTAYLFASWRTFSPVVLWYARSGYEHSHVAVSTGMLSFPLSKYHTGRLQHPTVSACLTLSRMGELFSGVAELFCIPTSSGWELELLSVLASTWRCQLQFHLKYWQPCNLEREATPVRCATYLLCLLTKYLDQNLTSEPWTVQIRCNLVYSLNLIPLRPPMSMTVGRSNSLGNMETETKNPTVTGESRQTWSSLKKIVSPKDCH